MDKDRIEQRWDGTMGQTAISCTDRKRPGSLPELRLTKTVKPSKSGAHPPPSTMVVWCASGVLTACSDQVDAMREATDLLEQRAASQSSSSPPKPFPKLLKDGYVALVDAVRNIEFARSHPFAQKFDAPHWRRTCFKLLCSIPEKMLKGIMDGTYIHNVVRNRVAYGVDRASISRRL
jgi:hypothetical protein